MMKLCKKVVSFVLVFAMSVGTPGMAEVFARVLVLTLPTFTLNGVRMYPLLDCIEAFGGTYRWEQGVYS